MRTSRAAILDAGLRNERGLVSAALVVGVAVLALLPVAASAGEASALTHARTHGRRVGRAAPSRCRVPAPHRALVHTRQLVVWEIARAHREAATIITYYACSPPHGAKHAIGTAESEGDESGSSIVRLSTAGPFVGLIEASGSKYGSSEILSVHDARTGEAFTIRVSDHPSDYSGGGEPQIQELRKLGNPIGEGANPYILDADGDLAWIGETEPSPGQPQQSVLYLHSRHETRKLTAAPEITDLAFKGTRLTWRTGGVAQSAPA